MIKVSVAKQNLWEKIRCISLFKDLPDQFLELLLNHGFPLTAPVNEFIFWENDIGDCAYLIIEGQVETISVNQGRPIQVLSEGDLFGEFAVFLNTPRALSVRTIAPSRFLVIERSVFQKLFAQSPELAAKVTNSLCHRWNELIDLGIFDPIDRCLSQMECIQLIYRRIRLTLGTIE